MINVNVVSRKLVKPCTRTPQNLKKYKLSFLDELSPRMEVGVLLFYTSEGKRSVLEESLAKILVQFYPLAGRYIDKGHFVNCSDEGAEFVEAEALEVELIHVIAERELEQLSGFLPRKNYQVDESIDPILSIQITKLKCGGLVIGIMVSHRVFDASSLGTFIAAWSNATNSSWPVRKIAINPNLDSPSLFPGKKQNNDSGDVNNDSNDVTPSITDAPKIVVKRFSFNMDAITSLKSKIIPNNGKRGFSRVRVVCALIAKALIGVDRVKYGGGQSRPSLLVQAVNIRERTIPPLPKHSCGNLAMLSLTRCMDASETKDMGIQELVYLLGDAIDESISQCGEILSAGEDGLNNIIINPVANAFMKSLTGEVNVVWFSDWSKFGFYEADFGWGKPAWATVVPLTGANTTVLMDNKEGNGIEAWVHLNYKDMPYFEQDDDIRFFTS